VNLFVINLRPNIAFQLDSISTRSNFTRLFPHGAAILLTDSLFLYHPAKALRILEWFRLCILENKPRKTWKFVMRPRLRDWILSIVEERSGEERKKYLQIFEQIYKLLPLDMLDDDDNYETPLENAPIVCPGTLDKFDFGVGLGDKKNDKDGIIRNDEFLAEWFAEWTRRHLDRHRKYHAVVGDGEGKDPRKDWGKRWTYVS
jgi:chromo domain-containing protein 1